ncbi:hypothetical protein ACHAPT_010983 [Fusarium lateritium]
MARPQSRKRKRADELPLQDDPPTNDSKRQRLDNDEVKKPQQTTEHCTPWQYPPEFWDRLSTIPLIRTALEELDRRTSRRRPSYPPPPTQLSQDLAPATARELAQFARHGGPDLRDLRGYPPATSNNQPARVMSSSSRSRATKSTNPTTAPAISGTTTTKKSTPPYNRGFEQHLTDHAIHPTWRSRRLDLEEATAALAVPRRSVSPSKFGDDAFETFQDNNARAKDEDDVKAYVVPTIIGTRRTDHPSAMNTLFSNLEALTDGTLAPANPDLYYGAYPEEVERSIRDDLAARIIPSTMEDKPMAPNFFLEVKGPDGSAAVAARQARYDGAIGSRIICTLQNHGREESCYDGQAKTFTSTYHDGTLKLFAHHITAPITEGGRPEYHMTQLRTFAMTDTRETFVQGATAFRNVRDLAKRHLDSAIQAANAGVTRATSSGPEDFREANERPQELHRSIEVSDSVALRDADDAL